MQQNSPCPLFAKTHCPGLKKGCQFHHKTQTCSQEEPVNLKAVIGATLRIANYLPRVGVASLIRKVSPKDINPVPASTPKTSPKFLRLLL